MELEIFRFVSNKEKEISEYLRIISYKSIAEPKKLLLVKVNETHLENDESDKESQIIEIYKVQFIASCKTKFDEEILVAFYLDETSQLYGNIISELPSGYCSPMVYLVDYKSYLEICEFTNEEKLPFMEYFNVIKSVPLGLNGFIFYKAKFYNYDEQKELFKQLDNEYK